MSPPGKRRGPVFSKAGIPPALRLKLKQLKFIEPGLLELPGGAIVIIDHKSAPIRREHCGAKAATFAAQLDGYRETMTIAGYTDIATWIHFPLAGVMATKE